VHFNFTVTRKNYFSQHFNFAVKLKMHFRDILNSWFFYWTAKFSSNEVHLKMLVLLGYFFS